MKDFNMSKLEKTLTIYKDINILHGILKTLSIPMTEIVSCLCKHSPFFSAIQNGDLISQ